MQQQPPPYQEAGGPNAQYSTKMAYSNPAPSNPGVPMQTAYVTNPGYAVQGQCVPPTITTTRTVVQQQPPTVFLAPGFTWHDAPVNLQCPICKTQIVTATESTPGGLTWIACFGLAAVGCVFGCCLIPFCVDDLKNMTHTCPNCRTELGTYQKW